MSEQSITMRECLMADINNLEDQRDFAMSEMERLKRERDEAREAFRTAMELAQQYKDERDEARNLADAAIWESDRLRSKLCRSCDREEKLVCERNEAWDTVLMLRKQRAIARNFGDQMERERDEAREAFAVATSQLVQSQEALREIAAADRKTSGELRGMAKRVLEGKK